MKFYERYYKSCYDEIMAHYPRYYREVLEMIAILKVQGGLADEIEEHIEQAYLNCFILTADETTIKGWEELLEITYTRGLTLDQRKAVVIARISGYGRIGEQEIRAIIALYTDTTVTVDFKHGTIFITIDGNVFDEDNLWKTIIRRIPAHLALDMQINIQRTFRQVLNFSFGGAIDALLKSEPVSEDRTSSSAFRVGYGGFLLADLQGTPPDAKRASSRLSDGAGGAYCHTHIKSKLIE